MVTAAPCHVAVIRGGGQSPFRHLLVPIDGSAVQRLMTERPQIAEARTSYTYWPGTQSVPFFAGRRTTLPHVGIDYEGWVATRVDA